MSEELVISSEHAAQMLGISKVAVLKAYHKGSITGYKMGPGSQAPIGLYRASVEAYARQREARLHNAHRDAQKSPDVQGCASVGSCCC